MEDIPAQFTKVETLVDEDGLVAPITMREKDGNVRLSFAVMREFDRKGRTEQTAYLHRRHIDGARRLLDKVEKYLDAEEDRIRAARRRPAEERKGA